LLTNFSLLLIHLPFASCHPTLVGGCRLFLVILVV
jgi:hypothetical protein